MQKSSIVKIILSILAAAAIIFGVVVGIKHISDNKKEDTSGTSTSQSGESSSDESGTADQAQDSTAGETETETTAAATTKADKTTTVKHTKPPKTTKTPKTEKTTKRSGSSGGKETMTYHDMDYSCFDDCAFIGNSRVLDLKNYGLAENVYASVGLTVDTVFTEKASGSSVVIIDELKGKHFKKVFLMFGDNECGWPNTSVFIKRYAKVIAAVRERVPEAEIYLQSVLPISRAADAKNEYGCNNAAINKVNEAIKQLAKDEGVRYINPAASMTDSQGFLPDEAASDGVHLRKKYCRIWLNYLADNM
jgi:hypothetical protein